MYRAPALIVGGGPAGSAAAIHLARAGARPMLIERHREPQEMVCGGFLGWDALAALDRLGVPAGSLGARPIGQLRLAAGDRMVEANLPRIAAGLSRCTLDAALLARAESLGTRVERGVAARGASGTTLRLAGGGEISGDALLLATGKHDLRGSPGRARRRAMIPRSACARGSPRRRGWRARWPARSSSICSIAAMPGCCCRRMAA